MAASLSDGKLLLMRWVCCQVLALLVRRGSGMGGGLGGQGGGVGLGVGGLQRGGPFNPVR